MREIQAGVFLRCNKYYFLVFFLDLTSYTSWFVMFLTLKKGVVFFFLNYLFFNHSDHSGSVNIVGKQS